MVDLILYSRDAPLREVSWIGQAVFAIKGTKPTDPDYTEPLISPEAIIVKFFAKLVKKDLINFTLRFTNEVEAIDDIYG